MTVIHPTETSTVKAADDVSFEKFAWRKWALPVFFAAFVLVALSGQWLAPRDPNDIDLISRFQPPFHSLENLLGTDQLGRDILSRTLVGASLSLSLAAAVISLSGLIGISVGMMAGFIGGAADAILMRFVDAMLSIPAVMLTLLLIAVMGTGFWSVVIALMLVTWARYARFVRAEVMVLQSREYIDAAIICGTPSSKILWRHFLPNIINSILVLLTLDIGRVILLESSLAFLGLGLPPDRAAWGATIAEGKAYLQVAPWITLAPAFGMSATILLANAFGNWMSDHLDPRLRRSGL
jgi:peptide/nickel transport system permease protein